VPAEQLVPPGLGQHLGLIDENKLNISLFMCYTTGVR
jgi:hypothetical protein